MKTVARCWLFRQPITFYAEFLKRCRENTLDRLQIQELKRKFKAHFAHFRQYFKTLCGNRLNSFNAMQLKLLLWVLIVGWCYGRNRGVRAAYERLTTFSWRKYASVLVTAWRECNVIKNKPSTYMDWSCITHSSSKKIF